MDRALSTQLIVADAARFEAQQIQHLTHRDFSAEYVEVDARHDTLLSKSALNPDGTEKRHWYFQDVTRQSCLRVLRR
jgi:hypothetical protein